MLKKNPIQWPFDQYDHHYDNVHDFNISIADRLVPKKREKRKRGEGGEMKKRKGRLRLKSEKEGQQRIRRTDTMPHSQR